MKNRILIALAASLCFSGYSQETNAPTDHVRNLLGDVNMVDLGKRLVTDGYGAVKGLSFADGIVVEPFGLYHGSDLGGGLAVSTAHTNGFNAGFAIAAIRNGATRKLDFYDATLSVSLGKTYNVPLLNIPLYMYVDTGPAVNLNKPNAILEQSVLGGKIFLGKNKQMSLGGGIGHNSEWMDSPFYILHFSYRFGSPRT